MPERSFSEEEVREILRRAVDREAGRSGGLDRERLIAAAQEIGIDAAHVDAAIGEVERDRGVETELASLRVERRHQAVSSLSTFGIVNTGLFALDWANGGGLTFFFYPLTVWGMILLLRYKGMLFKNDGKDRKAAAERIEKRQAELERQLAKQRRKAKGQRLEDVIERGVDALVGAASRHLEGRSARPPEPPPPPPAWSPRTRVDAVDEPANHDDEIEPGARRRRERR